MPLAQSGLRFRAAWQDEAVTRRRIASGECWIAELDGRIIATATLRPRAMHLAMDTAEGASDLIRYYARLGYGFVEHVKWEVTNYRSVVLSKQLEGVPGDLPMQPTGSAGG